MYVCVYAYIHTYIHTSTYCSQNTKYRAPTAAWSLKTLRDQTPAARSEDEAVAGGSRFRAQGSSDFQAGSVVLAGLAVTVCAGVWGSDKAGGIHPVWSRWTS